MQDCRNCVARADLCFDIARKLVESTVRNIQNPAGNTGSCIAMENVDGRMRKGRGSLTDAASLIAVAGP